MNSRIPWLIMVVMISVFSLVSPSQSAAVVVYLDELGAASGYMHPQAYDPLSALSLLASPPSEAVAGKKLFSAVLPGTKVIGVHTDGGATVVNLSRQVIGVGLDEARLEQIFEQVRDTLWQFGVTGEVRILADGSTLSQYVPAPAPVAPSAQALAAAKDRVVGITSLSGRTITLSPGHGKRWNGTMWNTARPVYCSPLNQEDYHNLEIAQYLEAYLLQDSCTVKMMRCTNKSQGASPWAGGTPWWQMGACYWLQNIGYPEAVYAPSPPIGSGGSDDTNEIQSRPLSSDYDNADIYISLHTNGYTGDCTGTCPTGTCTYYDAGTEHAPWGAVSQDLGNHVNSAIVDAVRTKYVDAGWTNRGVFNSDGGFGEIRIPDRAAILIELAFHDSCDTDAVKLRDSFFRSTTMWGVYKGVCDYFGTTPTWDFYSDELVSHDIPTAMGVGEIRTVHVTMRNRGVLWNDAKAFHLGAVGDSDPFTATTRQAISGEVGPNTTYTYTFNLKAPNAVGTFTTDWRMLRDGYTWFGPTVTQDIEVTGTPDYDPPTAPTDLSGSSTYSYRINLTWTASTDNVGVVSYNIYRDNVKIGSSATTSYTDSTCSAGTTYTYEVTALDTVPNESARSLPAILTSQDADSVAPTVPGNLHSTAVAATSVSLAWTASTDYYGVVGYKIYRNNAYIGSSATTSYTDNTCSPSTAYTYEVTAYDAIPNESGRSNSAVVTTLSAYTQIWAEGFDGSVANWTQGTTPFTYSPAKTHGTYTGAGAAYGAAAGANQMYRSLGTRPFAEGHVSGYFFDGKNGYKSGVCGRAYRQSLSLRDGGGSAMFLDNEFYSSTSNTNYFYRSYGGSGTHTAYGTRWATTNCIGAWIYFESTVTPNAPGASPIGTWVPKCTDGGGAVTGAAVNVPANFFTYGIGRVTMGLGVSSTNECYWDDIRFEATAPGAPTIGAATANSASQITWTWSRADNVMFGFNVADGSGTMKSPQYPTSGWIARSATSWAETGLTANTQYTRRVLGWNGSLDGAYSGTVSKYTLSPAPTVSNVTGSRAVNSWSADPDVEFTAVGGFGAGKVQYYRIAWDQSTTHTWTGTEPVWSEDTTVRTAGAAGSWYLHVRGYNAEDAANGSLDLGPYKYDVTPPGAPTVTDEGIYTPSTTELTASWTAADLESGIAEYKYAIGTTSGGNDIWDWTTTSSVSVTKTGLTLSAGSTYYFSVKAKNNAGLWGDAGNSDGITVVAPSGTIAQAKTLADEELVSLVGKVVTANFGTSVYIEESDGSSGIRVDTAGPIRGTAAEVAGKIRTSAGGERYIADATLRPGDPTTMPFIPVLRTSHLGGAALNSLTLGVDGGIGVNNIGLLVIVAGKITHAESGFAYIDDGAAAQDGSGFVGIRVDRTGVGTTFTEQDYAIVMGISSILKVDLSHIPLLRPQSGSDVTIYQQE